MSVRACSNCSEKHIRCLHNNRATTPIRQKRGTACHRCKVAKVKCLRIPGSSCPRCKKLGCDCKQQDTQKASKVKAKRSNRASRTWETHDVNKSTEPLSELVSSTRDEQLPQEPSLIKILTRRSNLATLPILKTISNLFWNILNIQTATSNHCVKTYFFFFFYFCTF